MAATAFVRARIGETLKKEAATVLADMGLTVSDVVRIVLTKIAKEKSLPFEMRGLNKLTEETLEKSERCLSGVRNMHLTSGMLIAEVKGSARYPYRVEIDLEASLRGLA